MTTKLALTLDNEVILSAKEYAKRNGISLSKMVELYFKGIKRDVSLENIPLPPITKELSGYAKINTSKSDKELLAAALENKYL